MHQQSTLQDVLTHPNLSDQTNEDESEWGRQLVSSMAGWHIEMAQWIEKVQQAEAAEELEEWDEALQVIKSQYHSSIKCKLITLNNLFGGTKYKSMHPLRTIGEEEEEAMEQAMAEALEDEWLDDGAIKIGSDEEYH